MSLAAGHCGDCGASLAYEDCGKTYSRVIGVEYEGGYDGVSEWRCPDCGRREGRWTGNVLTDGDSEPRYGGAR